jgi:two-component system, OmpR family, sensor kinase
MNRYSENIAELLLLGRTELDDFYAARSSLEDGLARLTTLVEDEIEFVRTAAERAAETEELARVNKMWELFENIDLRRGSSKSMQARLRSRAIPRVSPS